MWKELESNSGLPSRSYGLEMIGFPILYWGVLHDESSLHSKSTPIKKGLFIPLWDVLWMFAWNERFQPLSLFTSNALAFAGISTMRVYVFCNWACILVHCGLRILFQACRFTFYLHTLACLCLCSRAGTCASAVMSLSVYSVSLFCLCQWLHVGKACYIKSEVVEPGAGASEFICIHSTACLSSEPILITSSSGLLQHCAYSLLLSPSVKKWAAGGAFL